MPSRDDFFQIGRQAIITTPDIQFSKEIVDVQGSDINVINGMAAVVAESLIARLAKCMRELFAATARGSAQDRVIVDRSNLIRKDEHTATVSTLRLARPTAGAGAGIVPAGTRVQTTGGVQFGLDNDVSFGALDLVKSDVAGTCLTAGVDGNAAQGLITQIVDVPFDATITVLNLAAASGGLPIEDDIRYLGRYRGFFPTIRRGTKGAIQQGGLDTDGVAVATAFEILNEVGFPAGLTQLVVGDLDGIASGTTVQAVKDNLLGYRCLGIPVDVFTGLTTFQPVTWGNLQFDPGVAQGQKLKELAAVTVARTQFYAPGATMFRSDLIAAAKAVQGVRIQDSSLIIPAGDVVPTDVEQVLRTRDIDVTFA